MCMLKKIISAFLTSTVFAGIFVVSVQAQPTLEKLWLTEGLKVPESVLVFREGRTNYLLVSQIDGDPSVADGQGGIAKMSLSGDLDKPDWVTGLNAPKGMGVYGGKLYVADLTEVVVINLKSAEIEKKIPVPGAQFLNDITVDSKGVVYVSDTKTNKVHRIINDVVEDYLQKVESANGLKMIGPNLVVGSGTHLLLFDGQKNKLQIATGFAQAIDGVEAIGKGDFLVSCWQGLIYYVHLDGRIELLLDSQQAKINTADIGFDSVTQTVFVPNFFKNSVTAYKVVDQQ